MSTLRADNVGPSAGGTTRSLVRGTAAAWANLNGTGTIALRDSLNIASVLDAGTGDYRFTVTTAMLNANYCFNVTGVFGTDSGFAGVAPTTTVARASTYTPNTGAPVDAAYVMPLWLGDLA